MKYETIEKGTYVMKEGDPSNDKFYIILSGKASVIFKKEVNVYAQQNIEELRLLEEEQKSAQQLSPKKFKAGYSTRISQFATSVLEDQEKQAVEQNKDESPTIKRAKLFKHAATSAIISNRLSSNTIEPVKDEQNTHEPSMFSPFRKTPSTITSQFASNTDSGRNPKKLSIKTTKSEQMKRALGQASSVDKEGEIIQLDLNEHGTINKILEIGNSFGEKALTNPGAKRSASIYTLSDCEFIILMKKDFMSVFNRFNKANNQKLAFLLATVPNLNKVNSRLILEDYMYSVQIADSIKGSKLTEQGKTGERVYFIANGHCILEKEVDIPNPEPHKNILAKRKTTVQVARLGPGAMIGEEILFGPKKDKRYRYTTTVILNLNILI